MRFHWYPENVAHIARHDLTSSDVEAIFRAKDFGFDHATPRGRYLGEGTVGGKLYRVVFTVPVEGEVLVITAHRIRRTRRKP